MEEEDKEDKEENHPGVFDAEQELFVKVVFTGIITAIVCTAIWVGLAYVLPVRIGYMSLGVGIAIGFVVRKISQSMNVKYALIAGILSFVAVLSGCFITPWFAFMPLSGILFALIAFGEGYYFVNIYKKGPYTIPEDDGLDELLIEKENLKRDNVGNNINKDDDDYYSVKRLKQYRKRY
jgi:ABC-type transport system involved in multi-copper enzyme maturation permease subunit